MTAASPVIAAKARATAARLRLDATVTELQDRLRPATLVHNAWSTTVDRGADAWDLTVERGTERVALVIGQAARAGDAVTDFPRKRPGVVVAALTGVVALLAGPTLVRRALRPAPPKPIPTDPPRLTGPIPHLEIRP